MAFYYMCYQNLFKECSNIPIELSLEAIRIFIPSLNCNYTIKIYHLTSTVFYFRVAVNIYHGVENARGCNPGKERLHFLIANSDITDTLLFQSWLVVAKKRMSSP
jgi:hypothetical protein